MDLNPVFTSSTAFRPATTGGELALFASVGISLVHGWLIDPESPAYAAVSRVKDYDSAVNLIVEADVLTRGLLVGNGVEDDADCASSSQAGPSDSGVNLSDEEMRKVEDGELPYPAWVLASLIRDSSRRDKDVPRKYALTTHVHRAVHTRLSPAGVSRLLQIRLHPTTYISIV
jgi:hypothetical protein